MTWNRYLLFKWKYKRFNQLPVFDNEFLLEKYQIVFKKTCEVYYHTWRVENAHPSSHEQIDEYP